MADPEDLANATEDGSAQLRQIPFLTEAVVLAALSGLSYFYAHIFEVGYSNYFGISSDLIQIKMDRFIIIFFLFLTYTILFIVLAEVIFHLEGITERFQNISGIRGKFLYFLIVPFLLLILFTNLMMYFVTSSIYVLLFGIPAIIFVAFVGALMIMILRRKKIDSGKIVSYFKEKISEGVLYSIIGSVKIELIVVLLLAVTYAPIQIYFFAKLSAKEKVIYLVSESDGDWVLVRAYDSYAILSEFDPMTKALTGKYRFVQLGADGEQLFVRKEIGSLAPPN